MKMTCPLRCDSAQCCDVSYSRPNVVRSIIWVCTYTRTLVRTLVLECAYVHLRINSVLMCAAPQCSWKLFCSSTSSELQLELFLRSLRRLQRLLIICLSYSKAFRMAEDLNLVDEDYITRMTGFEADCNDGKGDPMACHQVGEFFSLVKDDRVRAGKVYEKNCTDKNYSASCFNLAKLYMTGKGVTQSDEKAESFFKQSCTGGHLYGCYHQVIFLLDGLSDMTEFEVFHGGVVSQDSKLSLKPCLMSFMYTSYDKGLLMYLADDEEHKTSNAAKAPATPVTTGPKDMTKVGRSNDLIILIVSNNMAQSVVSAADSYLMSNLATVFSLCEL